MKLLGIGIAFPFLSDAVETTPTKVIHTAPQSANLVEWVNSSGNVTGSIGTDGSVSLYKSRITYVSGGF